MKTVCSMTGYGEATWDSGEATYLIVVKSLNHRFLETRVKIPPKYDSWEFEIQRKVKERFDRGRIDLVISETAGQQKKTLPAMDLELAARYVELMNALKDSLSLPGEVNLDIVCRMRDVIYQAAPTLDIQNAWTGFEPVLDGALERLMESRAREGEALTADLMERLEHLRQISAAVEKEAPGMITLFRDRLIGRIKELSDDRLNVDRIEEEVVLFADRIDFTEELVRLTTHIGAFSRAMAAGGPMGRKLDFLLQEMGREINTIGNKNVSPDISHQVVSAKVELEKMRQQIQNIE
jgi:uncharacterized protein (TIGR00255 family)